MKVTSISDFRENVRQYVDSVISNNGSLVINRGKTAAVLISLEEYNSIKATESIVESPVESERLVAGISEWRCGEGIEVNIEDL